MCWNVAKWNAMRGGWKAWLKCHKIVMEIDSILLLSSASSNRGIPHRLALKLDKAGTFTLSSACDDVCNHPINKRLKATMEHSWSCLKPQRWSFVDIKVMNSRWSETNSWHDSRFCEWNENRKMRWVVRDKRANSLFVGKQLLKLIIESNLLVSMKFIS